MTISSTDGPLNVPAAVGGASSVSVETLSVPAAAAAGSVTAGVGAAAAASAVAHSGRSETTEQSTDMQMVPAAIEASCVPAGCRLNEPATASTGCAAVSDAAPSAAAAWNVPIAVAVALNVPVPVDADSMEPERKRAAAARWIAKPPAVGAPSTRVADAPAADHEVKLVKLATCTHVSSRVRERLVQLAASDTTSDSGLGFVSFRCRLGSRTVDCGTFDAASDERYRIFNAAYLRDSHAVIIAFDVAQRGDLERARALHRNAKKAVPDVPCVFFGVRVNNMELVAVSNAAGSLAPADAQQSSTKRGHLPSLPAAD